MSEHGTFLASTAADLTVCVTWRYPKKTWEHSYKGSDVHICVVGTGLDHRVPADHLLASSSLLFHRLSLLSLFFIIYIYFSVFIFTLFEPHRHTFESSSYGNPNPIRLLPLTLISRPFSLGFEEELCRFLCGVGDMPVPLSGFDRMIRFMGKKWYELPI